MLKLRDENDGSKNRSSSDGQGDCQVSSFSSFSSGREGINKIAATIATQTKNPMLIKIKLVSVSIFSVLFVGPAHRLPSARGQRFAYASLLFTYRSFLRRSPGKSLFSCYATTSFCSFLSFWVFLPGTPSHGFRRWGWDCMQIAVYAVNKHV